MTATILDLAGIDGFLWIFEKAGYIDLQQTINKQDNPI
jgi:hypothetical protein